MPTLRSQFSIEQFEAALQKLAHGIPRFTGVQSEDMTIRFHYSERGHLPTRVRVELHRKRGEYLGFSIEPKAYTDSPDNTRISFNYKGEKEKILQWLKKLMGSETPIPRFSLEKYAQG